MSDDSAVVPFPSKTLAPTESELSLILCNEGAELSEILARHCAAAGARLRIAERERLARQRREAVKLIDRNVTGVCGDLDRLFDTVERERGRIDVLYSSAGMGEPAPLGEITE